jgi:hypothetical protein
VGKTELIYEKAINAIRKKSKGNIKNELYEITINFHPDRFTQEGLPLLCAIAQDKCLKSQFETGTSNGGLTAFVGGDRWKWEHDVFNGTYDKCPPSKRPKYGALNYKKLSTGASPRFGSSYFRLKSHVIKRTTFCYPDSFFEPKNFGTYEFIGSLIELASTKLEDELDCYIEAQIHGILNLPNDVDAIVLDPAYLDTDVEAQARRLPVEVQWHNGYELKVEIIEEHSDYRGKEYVELAKKIAVDGYLNPRILGDAINYLGCDNQGIKKVWHYLAKFGLKST